MKLSAEQERPWSHDADAHELPAPSRYAAKPSRNVLLRWLRQGERRPGVVTMVDVMRKAGRRVLVRALEHQIEL